MDTESTSQNGIGKYKTMINITQYLETNQSPVEWLAERYNYVTWMRNRDEISGATADEWRKKYLEEAKEMETKLWATIANETYKSTIKLYDTPKQS